MKYVIKGGKIQTITNGVIENGIIIVEDHKIIAVGSNLDIPSDAQIIDAKNHWVTPGLIDAHTHIGVIGDPNVPASRDVNELSSPNTAEVRVIDAINPQSPSFKLVREHGVTTEYTGPGSANLFGGTGVALKMYGNTIDQMIYPGSEAMKMAVGENPKRVYGSQKKEPMTRMGIVAVWRKGFVEAQNYLNRIEQAKNEGKPLPDRNLRLEMVGKVLTGELMVRIHAHRADDIITAIRVAEEFGFKYAIEHCTEGYKVVDVLAQKDFVAVVGPLLMEPAKQETWDVRMETPAILANAGVKVCIQTDKFQDGRWLHWHVGLAMRAGLSEEDAFLSVTMNAAELLGIDNRVGSLEVGKDADIVIWDGYPFSNFTSVKLTMIDGNIVYQK